MSQNPSNKGKIKWSSDRKAKASRNFESDEHGRARKKAEANSLRQASARGSHKGLKIAGVLAVLAAIVVAGVFFIGDKKPVRKPVTELMPEYENIPLSKLDTDAGKLADEYQGRNHWVLEQIKDGNITSSSTKLVTVRVTGKSGTVVEFEIMLHAIRVGNDVSWFMFPLDGPYSLAACKILDLDLPTRWMAKQLRIKAFEGVGKVRFIAMPEIKVHQGKRSVANERDYSLKGLGRHKGPTEMRWPSSIRAHGELFLVMLAKKKWDPKKPISGHFKEVIQDPAKLAQGKLATFRACAGGKEPEKDWQKKEHLGCALWAEKHPPTYHDYSHGVRCAKSKLKVGRIRKDGSKQEFIFKEMTIIEFYASEDYRKEFSLPSKLDDTPYKYPPHLEKWLEDNK